MEKVNKTLKTGVKEDSNPKCRVTIRNSVPAQYNVVITVVGMDFIHRAGEPYRIPAHRTNITSGTATAYDDTDNRCVNRVTVVLEVTQQGHPPATLVGQQDADGPDKCVFEVTFNLAPRNGVDLKSLKGENINDLLEIA